MAVAAEWKNDRFSVGLCSIPFRPTKRTDLDFEPGCLCLSEYTYVPDVCSCWEPGPRVVTVSGLSFVTGHEGDGSSSDACYDSESNPTTVSALDNIPGSVTVELFPNVSCYWTKSVGVVDCSWQVEVELTNDLISGAPYVWRIYVSTNNGLRAIWELELNCADDIFSPVSVPIDPIYTHDPNRTNPSVLSLTPYP